MHNFNDFLNDDGYTPRSQIRLQVFDQYLRIILCRHTVHPRGKLYSTNVVQSAFPRSVHVAEVVSLALVSNCLHLRLNVWTESLKIIILVHIVQFLSRHTVIECVSSLAYQLDILITCAIVKIILAGVDSTSDVKTLRIDLNPTSQLRTLQTNSLDVRLVGLILISVILCLISLPFNSSFTFSCNSSSVVPRSAPLRLTSRCLHGPSHAASGLAGLAVLAVEHRSPLTPSARCVWRSLTSCHQRSSLSGCIAFLVCFKNSS